MGVGRVGVVPLGQVYNSIDSDIDQLLKQPDASVGVDMGRVRPGQEPAIDHPIGAVGG